MEILIVVRDVLIAVLLSWLGAESEPPKEVEKEARASAILKLVSDSGEDAALLDAYFVDETDPLICCCSHS